MTASVRWPLLLCLVDCDALIVQGGDFVPRPDKNRRSTFDTKMYNNCKKKNTDALRRYFSKLKKIE